MPRFNVVRTSVQEVEVEAEDREHALEVAHALDANAFAETDCDWTCWELPA